MKIRDGAQPEPSETAVPSNRTLVEAAGWLGFILPLAGLWLAVLLIGTFDFGWGVQRSVVFAAILLSLPLMGRRAVLASTLPSWLRAAAWGVSVLLTAWHVGVMVTESPKRVQIDVASTTIAAGDLMFQGRNPYRIPIDYRPEITAPINVHGYKYGPVMAIAYRPFVVLFDENGVRIANLVLDAVTALLVYALARRLAGSIAALIALPLYLSLSTIPALLYTEPFNDLGAVVPLALAFLVSSDRPFAAGLLAGLSISAKLLPGAIFLPFLFPKGVRVRLWFLAGVFIGLLPLAVYLVMSPRDLLGNILTFNFLRPIDSSSWMMGLPDWVSRISKVIAGLISLACTAVVVLWPRLLTWRDRMLLAVACTILVSLAGFGIRRNYVLWWLPFATVLVAAHAASRLPGRTGGLTGPTPSSEAP